MKKRHAVNLFRLFVNFNPALEVLLNKECHFHAFWDVYGGELIVLDGAAFEHTHVRITNWAHSPTPNLAVHTLSVFGFPSDAPSTTKSPNAAAQLLGS